MSIPKEPRQQMINIMYLVLTALLALNVSSEILNAFSLLNKSIDNSNVTMAKKLKDGQNAFTKAIEKNPFGAAYQPFVDKAVGNGKDAIDYIDKVMADMTSESNGPDYDGALGPVKSKRDKGTTTRMMIEEGRGAELKTLLAKTRNDFLGIFSSKEVNEDGNALFKPTDLAQFTAAMPMEDYPDMMEDEHGKPVTWDRKMFYQMPMAPALTLLNKMKNDVVATQAMAVEKLLGKVSEEELLFDKYLVGVVPNGSKFIQGETYEAKIFLAASSSEVIPTIKVNGSPLKVDANGQAEHKPGKLNSTGEKSYTYSIDYKDSYGKQQNLKETIKIGVVPPPDHVAVVSPDKMNVFYIGVDNPVTASITGIPSGKTTVNMSGGTINKGSGAGAYVVKPDNTPGKKATVNLSGKNQLGESVNLKSEFRIKRIPNPTPEVGGKSGGKMGTGEWKAQQAVFAMLHDFDFDARFNVMGFEMTLAQKGQDLQICTNRGGKFEGQCASIKSKAKVGDIYYIDNIKAKGPDGSTRSLPTLAFKIK